MDYPCAKFGDFSFSRCGFIMRTDRQNLTHTQTRMTVLTYVFFRALSNAAVAATISDDDDEETDYADTGLRSVPAGATLWRDTIAGPSQTLVLLVGVYVRCCNQGERLSITHITNKHFANNWNKH